MNKSNAILPYLSFFAYAIVQVMILQNVVLFDKSFCFLYVAFLLLLPVDIGVLGLLVLGFVTGLVIDIFYDSLGIHAAASVLIMFIRNYWLNLITPQGGYDSGAIPSIELNGWQWFLGYIFPLIFIHHLVLFYIEASGFGLFGFTLLKVIFSTLFTSVSVIIVQYIFYKRRRS
jgi:hypothetical protein